MSTPATEPQQSLPRLYKDLSWIWPLWGSVEDYRTECEFFNGLLDKHSPFAVNTLLDLGCGGGKTACNLARYYKITGIDLSQEMLSLARELTSDAQFILGDMRTVRLGRTFDAVFINDSIAYMRTLEDLEAVFRTARLHLRPGGVMLVIAEVTRETLVQNQTHTSFGEHDNLQLTFLQNYFDPNPDDTEFECVLTFIIREKGRVRIEHDLHHLGLFSQQQWEQTLAQAGFNLRMEQFPPGLAEECPGASLFVCTAA